MDMGVSLPPPFVVAIAGHTYERRTEAVLDPSIGRQICSRGQLRGAGGGGQATDYLGCTAIGNRMRQRLTAVLPGAGVRGTGHLRGARGSGSAVWVDRVPSGPPRSPAWRLPQALHFVAGFLDRNRRRWSRPDDLRLRPRASPARATRPGVCGHQRLARANGQRSGRSRSPRGFRRRRSRRMHRVFKGGLGVFLELRRNGRSVVSPLRHKVPLYALGPYRHRCWFLDRSHVRLRARPGAL